MFAPAYLVDHIFICTAARGPAAELLRQAGLTEGTPNRHPGQGTACRRFFFSNAMLELLWLEDEAEIRSEQTCATKLWERFAAGRTASPFGVILRPAPGSEPVCPWRSWTYRPPAMPGLELEIAADTELGEPMWCLMKTGRAPAEWPRERRQPLDHPAGFREITRLIINCPDAKETSVTRAMALNRVIALNAFALLNLHVEARRVSSFRIRSAKRGLEETTIVGNRNRPKSGTATPKEGFPSFRCCPGGARSRASRD